MRVLLLAAFLPVMATAAEPWSHGLSKTAVVETTIETAWHGVFGEDQLHFVDFGVGGPVHRSKSGSWSLGLRLDAGFTTLFVPSQTRSYTEGRSFRGTLQFAFYGPKRKSFHAVSLVGGLTPSNPAAYYWLSPSEAFNHMGTRYDGYVASKWVDVSIAAGMQFNSSLAGTLFASTTVIVHPAPVFALYAGIRSEANGTSWFASGLRFRAGIVEFGGYVHLPIGAMSSGYPLARFHVRPSAELRFTPGRASMGAD